MEMKENEFLNFYIFEMNHKLRQKQKKEDLQLFTKSFRDNKKNLYTSVSQGISMI